MDKIYTVSAVLAALILPYILWCIIEPFFFDLDSAVLKRSSGEGSRDKGITVKKLPPVSATGTDKPDLRFFFFSDIHTEWCPVSSGRLCNAIRKSHLETPLDAVIFGGDIVTYPRNAKNGYKYLSAVSSCCKELGIPFYGVSGNHDSDLINAPKASGFISLDNRTVTLNSNKNGTEITLAGLPDSGRKNRVWSSKMTCGNETPVILVVHDPDAFIHLDPGNRPEYMLSGHLHGGQMKFPFRIEFTVLRKSDKLPQMGAVQGPYDISGTKVFISRGLGCGLLPFRFLSVPEATVIGIFL